MSAVRPRWTPYAVLVASAVLLASCSADREVAVGSDDTATVVDPVRRTSHTFGLPATLTSF